MIQIYFCWKSKLYCQHGNKTIEVGKDSSTLIFDCPNVAYGDVLNVTIKLTNLIESEPITGTVKIYINETWVCDVSVVNGEGNFTSSILPAGNYDIKAVFEGDNEYTDASREFTVYVGKANPI